MPFQSSLERGVRDQRSWQDKQREQLEAKNTKEPVNLVDFFGEDAKVCSSCASGEIRLVGGIYDTKKEAGKVILTCKKCHTGWTVSRNSKGLGGLPHD